MAVLVLHHAGDCEYILTGSTPQEGCVILADGSDAVGIESIERTDGGIDLGGDGVRLNRCVQGRPPIFNVSFLTEGTGRNRWNT